jgi:hypothetical protein
MQATGETERFSRKTVRRREVDKNSVGERFTDTLVERRMAGWKKSGDSEDLGSSGDKMTLMKSVRV